MAVEANNYGGGSEPVLRVASGNTRADVERALPQWCAQRHRLNLDRIRHRDTTGGERTAVNIVRIASIFISLVLGVWIGWLTFTAAGPMAGFAAGVGTLGMALALASAGVGLARAHFDRLENERQESVARLELAIRVLDKRIAQAFREHGLIGHTLRPV